MLEDDVFHFHKERNKVASEEPYTAKLCHPLWFDDIDLSGLSSTEAQTILKYRGDVAYHNARYDAALRMYQQCQDQLQANNVSMRRGVEEDKARCYLRLGQLENAISCARNVSEMAFNFEQVTDALQLFLDIYRTADIPSKISSTLKSLLLLHPNNSAFWVQLGDIYFASLSSNWSGDTLSIEEHSSTDSEQNSLPDVKHISKDLDNLRTPIQDCCDETYSESKLFPKFNDLTTLSNIVDTHQTCKDRCRRICSKEFSVLACLTCYLASSLLLKSICYRQNSFAKSRNKTMQMKVNSRMGILQKFGIEALQTECSDFLKVALNLSDAEDRSAATVVDEIALRRVLNSDDECEETFTKKWFSWSSESTFIYDRLQQPSPSCLFGLQHKELASKSC